VGRRPACGSCPYRDTDMTYRAPINDIAASPSIMAPGLQAAVKAGHYGDFDADITAAVLEEAGRFASGRAGAPQPGWRRNASSSTEAK